MPTNIYAFTVNDLEKPQRLHDVVQRTASQAGIHDLYTQDHLNQSSIVYSAAASSYGPYRLTFPYHPVYGGYTFGNNYVVECEPSGWGWVWVAARIVGDSGNEAIYTIATDASGYPEFRRINVVSGSYSSDTLLWKRNSAVNSAGKVRIMSRRLNYGSSGLSDDLWIALSLWVNDELIATVTELPPIVNQATSVYAGYGRLTAMASITFNNVRIRRMTEIIDSATIDPGETPLAGLQRSIEGYYHKMWLRSTGQLAVVKPRQQSSQATIPLDRVEAQGKSTDYRDAVSAVRMVGAYTEVDMIDTAMQARLGYKLRVVNNPFLLTKNECAQEAFDYIKRVESNANTKQITISALLLLEPEDRITIDGEDWIITSIQYQIDGTQHVQTLSLRKYTYG